MNISDLKARIFALLKEDIEFRYAVAGMLGLEEILRRLDRHESELVRLREDMIAGFRRSDEKFEEILQRLKKHDEKFEEILQRLERHDEILERHAQQIEKLREDLIAGFKRHDEEMAKLREDMVAGFKRHDDEILKLREDMVAGFKRHDEEMAKLREDMIAGFRRHDEILERHAQQIEKLREDFNREHRKLHERIDSLESAMISGFGEMSKFAGITFEEFVRKFLTAALRKSGEIPESSELSKGLIDGEEVDIFLEDPLIVGEVTSYAESAEDMLKLLRKAEAARAKYLREPRKILVVLTARKNAAKEIRSLAKEKSVELVIGKVVD